jgi:hypothetical protein
MLVQSRRNAKAAKRFFRKLLKGLQYAPRVLVTDKLKSYAAAKREILPGVNTGKVAISTTEPRYHISRPGDANGRCSVLSQPVTPSVSSPTTAGSTITFSFAVTACLPVNIAKPAIPRCAHGVMWPEFQWQRDDKRLQSRSPPTFRQVDNADATAADAAINGGRTADLRRDRLGPTPAGRLKTALAHWYCRRPWWSSSRWCRCLTSQSRCRCCR